MVASVAPSVAKAVKAKADISPEQLAVRQLQGRYLSLMRKIPANVMAERFSKQAIADQGKEAVVNAM